MIIKTFILRRFSIAHGSILFMLAFLSSALLGIVRQMAFNAQFGVSLHANAYYAAFRLPDTLATLLTSGTLANAIIPVLLTIARNEGDAAVERFLSILITTLLAVVAPLLVLCILLTPLLTHYLLVPGFDTAAQQLTEHLTRIMLVELLLSVVVSVFSAYLTSRNQFVLPAIAIATHNLTLLAGIAAARYLPGVGILGPTLGAVSDSFLQLCIVLPGIWLHRIRYTPIWELSNAHIRTVIALLIPNSLSAVINYAASITDTAFASFVPDPRAIPAIYNAWLLFHLPVRLFGVAIGQAAFPHLAEVARTHDTNALWRMLIRIVTIALAIGLAVLGGFIVMGHKMVTLLFVHGDYHASAGLLTYQMVVGYALALPAAIGTEIITRSLIALYDTRTPMVVNGIQFTLRLLIVPLCLPYIGIFALPLVFAATSTLETVLLGIMAWIRMHRDVKM